MNKIKITFFKFGFCIIFLSIIIIPLFTIITCQPREGSILDYIWYIFLIFCGICYSITTYLMNRDYNDMKDKLINIIDSNNKNDKNLNVIINSASETIDNLIL